MKVETILTGHVHLLYTIDGSDSEVSGPGDEEESMSPRVERLLLPSLHYNYNNDTDGYIYIYNNGDVEDLT